MKRLNLHFKGDLSEIYNLRDDKAKGRLITLSNSLLASIYNVFITGIFYTGFLTMYGISITEAGIIYFIPMIANCFGLFSSVILERIPRRKWVVLSSKVFFYAMYILATTAMPNFVTDPKQRLTCFGIILFIAYSVDAMFCPGITAWFLNFYPEDSTRRARYFSYNQIFGSIMSSVVLLTSGLISDAVSGSPFQKQLIIGLRYAAFFFILIDVAIQSRAREYPYPKGEKPQLHKVFTLPFKYKKFMACLALMFAWNFCCNLNGSLWTYHLLNHMDFSYTLINCSTVAYTIILLCTSGLWRRVLKRYSWIKTFGIAVLIFMPTEIFFFLMTKETSWMFFPLALIQNTVSVGLNFSYANILYMNLPKENSTAHISFYSVGCNLCAFLGMVTGTTISSISGDTPMAFLGLEIYSVQFTCLARFVVLFIIGMICVKKWKTFTSDREIAEIESLYPQKRKEK